MSTLRAGYIPQRKVTSASSSGSLGFIMNFHCVCVKCCRMVDSVPRWQLSLSRPIQSDHLLIADYDDTVFGAGTLTWQNPVHSWKAGPGEVMTVENKQTFRGEGWPENCNFCLFRGEGIKNGQNCAYIIYGWPHRILYKSNDATKRMRDSAAQLKLTR